MYGDLKEFKDLINKLMEAGRMLNHMIENPEKYLRKNTKSYRSN